MRSTHQVKQNGKHPEVAACRFIPVSATAQHCSTWILFTLRAVRRDGQEIFAVGLPTQATQTSRGLLGSFRMMLNSGNGYGYWGNFNVCNLADGGGRSCHTSGSRITAVDYRGHKVWQHELRSYPLAITADSKGRAYVTLSSGGLQCYSADGEELWRNSSLRNFTSAMSVAPDDRVFVETNEELVCIQP